MGWTSLGLATLDFSVLQALHPPLTLPQIYSGPEARNFL